MIRIAHIGDQHFNQRNRWDECLRVMAWIAQDIAARNVDLVLLGGDLFEKSPSHEETLAAALWVQQLANAAEVVGVYGNHDKGGSLDVLGELHATHPISIYATPQVHSAACGVQVACLPWPRKAHLLAALGREVGHEESASIAQEALRDVYRGLAHQMDARPWPRVGLAHVMIDGAKTDHEQPIVGADLAVSLADLGLLRADYIACSHIHMHQEFMWSGAWFVYAGAPYHCNYGEFQPGKGYVVLDVADGAIEWERVAAPCTPMVLVETTWDGSGFDGGQRRLTDAEQTGADVRLRYHVAEDQREAARAAAEDVKRELLDLGAARVTLDPVVRPVTRARAPEITEAKTLKDKLRTVWRVRGESLEPEREERVLGKLSILEDTAA